MHSTCVNSIGAQFVCPIPLNTPGFNVNLAERSSRFRCEKSFNERENEPMYTLVMSTWPIVASCGLSLCGADTVVASCGLLLCGADTVLACYARRSQNANGQRVFTRRFTTCIYQVSQP